MSDPSTSKKQPPTPKVENGEILLARDCENPISDFTHLYMWKVEQQGIKKTYEKEDLFKLPPSLDAEKLVADFKDYCRAKKAANPDISLKRLVLQFVSLFCMLTQLSPTIIGSSVQFFFVSLVEIFIPLVIKEMVDWIYKDDFVDWHGIVSPIVA